MTRLFAAIDSCGAVRFIGEVSRGAACGCVCPECASPLIARLGDEREWHFAHEAGQERPECEAGAVNMLRRLAVEYLRSRPTLALPRYSAHVTARSEQRLHTEDVRWDAQFVGALNWQWPSAKAEPVAIGRLDNGIDVRLLVEIANEPPKFLPPAPSAPSEVIFWCSIPALSDLRKRLYAEQHIARRGHFLWKHQRDVFGHVALARKRLQARAAADDHEMERWRKLQSEEAGRRWAEKARQLRQQSARSVAPVIPSEAAPEPVSSPLSAVIGPKTWPWAPKHGVNTSFVFYRMTDGSAWVIYTVDDGGSAIAAWPKADEGWDEALPARVGVPDAELGIYRIRDLAAAMMYFANNSVCVRASTDPSDFDGR